MTAWTADEAERLGRTDELQVASGPGAVERDVTFEVPGPEVADGVSGAYHAKYDRYGRGTVGTVVSP